MDSGQTARRGGKRGQSGTCPSLTQVAGASRNIHIYEAVSLVIPLFCCVPFRRSHRRKLKAMRAARLLDMKTGQYAQTPLSRSRPHQCYRSGAATLLPGLIDCHTRLPRNCGISLGGDDPNMPLTVGQMSAAKRAPLGVKSAARGGQGASRSSSITAVGDSYNSGHNGDVAPRDVIDSGWVTGPRIVASTRSHRDESGKPDIVPRELLGYRVHLRRNSHGSAEQDESRIKIGHPSSCDPSPARRPSISSRGLAQVLAGVGLYDGLFCRQLAPRVLLLSTRPPTARTAAARLRRSRASRSSSRSSGYHFGLALFHCRDSITVSAGPEPFSAPYRCR